MPDNSIQKEYEALKESYWRMEWRFNHAKDQYQFFMNRTIPLIDKKMLKDIFHDMGRNCARKLGWAKNFIGNPEGFFEHMSRHSGENISFDEEKTKITIVTKKRPCDCPIMKDRCLDGMYCECSIGWQMETYETILGRNVEVEIKESVFRGSDKCIFIVNIPDRI